METLTGVVLLVGAVTGVVELVKRAFDKDWKVVAIILGASVAGWLLGQLPEIGLTAVQGLVVGMSATGYVTLVQNIAKQ